MSTDRFEVCLAEILAHEGGYVDHPRDPGGATNLGITRATLAAWRNVKLARVPKSDVRKLSREEAADIYRARYWDVCRCGEMPPGIDLVVFDAAVNSGPRRSIKWLQASLGVKVNGYVGRSTITAAANGDAAAVVGGALGRRERFLRNLSTWKTFGRGWSRRLAAIRKSALGAVADRPAVAPGSPKSNLEPIVKGVPSMIQALLKAALSGVIAREINTVGDLVLTRAVKDPKAREKIRGDLAGALAVRQEAATTEIARVAETGSVDPNPWTKKARPTFLYVVYIMIFGAIPFGALYGFAPDFSGRFVEGMSLFLKAIPDLAWYLFGSAYLGYSGLRSWDKKNGASS